MYKNEIKILEVPDKLFIIVKKTLKDKKKEKKLILKEVMDNMPLIFVIYEIIHIDKCSVSFLIIGSNKMSLF